MEAMKKSELKELYQMMFPDYPDIVTVKQLRDMLGVSRALAYKLISDGEIQAVKIGTSLKIPKVSVINYVTEEKKEVRPSA
jgi:excisionase family DNA binding protein